MAIKKIIIENYKLFETFELEFANDINILVGDNETGKSTLLEAINLSLTGQLNGRNIIYELSPYIFNKKIADNYIKKIKTGENIAPPRILIELYLEETTGSERLKGTNNSKRENAPGISLSIEFDEEYKDEYNNYIKNTENIKVIPTEYYTVKWYSFASNGITKKGVPINCTFIDTTTVRLQNGADYYIQRIIDDNLNVKEKTDLAITYRKLKESFADEESIALINSKLKEKKGNITDKDFKVSIDITQRTGWETSLTSYLDDIPFQYIGKGDQSILKMLLALENDINDSCIVLIEEPENHLSFSTMNCLIHKIHEKCKGKQIILSTHSTFVLNKLGIDKLILLGKEGKKLTTKGLDPDTQKYFKKLPGYDTLRLIVAKKVILVEGPSDELIVQKAYLQINKKLPIESGIDVIAMRGLSFKRFLEIAKLLEKSIKVVTDNDGDYINNVEKKYSEYLDISGIKICYDKDNNYSTLEPQIVKDNDLNLLNTIFSKNVKTKDEIIKYMTANKTECALKLFETKESINFPQYILDAIHE